MVDWITAETPDPVGIPVNDGQLMRVSRTGQIEWTTPARLDVEGSWSSNMTFRGAGAEYSDDVHPARRELGLGVVKQSGLVVSGNPAKFLNGHNLFGSADVTDLLAKTIAKAKNAIWPDLFENPELNVSGAELSRLDLTGSFLLDHEADALPCLRAMEESVWCPYRGRGMLDGSTLYYGRVKKGGRAKDWGLKLYWKGREVTAHPIPRPAYEVPGLLDELNRTIRVELTLRRAELKRLGLQKVGDWTPAKVREIWEAYVAKLDLQKVVVNFDTVDLGNLGLKPRHVHALAAWRAGNDLRVGTSKCTFYRLRRELLKETGFDIALPFTSKSNVVPFRRLVGLSTAPRPSWADELTAVLERGQSQHAA
jgi:II/X family phage/plasmid replication protein